MANKRVSELAPITAPELDFADLLLLSDVTAHESKKLQLSDLSNFLLLDGRLTGSLFGTASYAFNSGTSSYTLNAPIPAIVPSASFLIYTPGMSNGTASYALAALSASYAMSSSYCITASYALTSSVELVYSSAFADYARTASYLLLSPGTTNGSASYALTASYVLNTQVSTSYSNTSSWAWNAITASRALSSLNADTASLVQTASYLAFNGLPNGTASYALVAGTITNVTQDYGIYTATTQSLSSSQVDYLAVTPALGGLKTTTVEAYGTIVLSYTSSASPTDGDIELVVVDRQYGYTHSLDASPVYAWIGGPTAMSGTLKYPFTLRGQADLNGLYEVYVTASNGVFIEPSRTARFKFTSKSDQVLVSSAEPMNFYSYPTNAIMVWSSSLHPANVYFGSASQVIFSGSNDVTELRVYPGTVNILQYTWTLSGAKKIFVDNNPGLTYLGGIPFSCITMSAANCGLTEIPLLASSSVGYLNVPNNTIVANLSLPASMSYLDVSNNFYVSLPITMPAGMQTLKADGVGITYTPYGLSDNLISMSVARCPRLVSWLAPTFPTSLKYFDSNNSPLTNTPYTMPAGLLYVNVATCSLNPTVVGNIASGLVANGLNNGYLAIQNNPASASAFSIDANVTTLRSRGWTVVA